MSYTKTTNHAAAMSNSTSQVYTATPPAVAHDGSILERIAQATYKRIEESQSLFLMKLSSNRLKHVPPRKRKKQVSPSPLNKRSQPQAFLLFVY